MKPQRSEAIRGIPIAHIEETIDAAMESVPVETIDLSLPENRAKLRRWMVRVCAAVVMRVADSMAKCAESAIQEAGALAINPDYYADIQKRREKRKIMKAAMQTQGKPRTRAEIAFERLTGKEAKQ